MIVKGTKQLGSFKRGINIYVPKKQIVIPPAPSGLPVASTNQIIVNGEVFAKTYIRFSIYRGELGDEYFGCTSDCGSNSIEDAVYFDGVVWRYDINHLNGGFNNSYSSHIATNPSNNPNFVPTTGWTPSITISSA